MALFLIIKNLNFMVIFRKAGAFLEIYFQPNLSTYYHFYRPPADIQFLLKEGKKVEITLTSNDFNSAWNVQPENVNYNAHGVSPLSTTGTSCPSRWTPPQRRTSRRRRESSPTNPREETLERHSEIWTSRKHCARGRRNRVILLLFSNVLSAF